MGTTTEEKVGALFFPDELTSVRDSDRKLSAGLFGNDSPGFYLRKA